MSRERYNQIEFLLIALFLNESSGLLSQSVELPKSLYKLGIMI